jgi:hypothetical protein
MENYASAFWSLRHYLASLTLLSAASTGRSTLAATLGQRRITPADNA